MTPHTTLPPVILVAGHWLGDWAWNDVTDHLRPQNRHVTAITLPGLDPDDSARTSRTLDDQVAAIVDTIAMLHGSAQHPVVIVAHSGANAPVSMVIDQHPELVRRVVWIDSGPVASGTVFAPGLPDEVEEIPLPEWEDLTEQGSLDGLTETDLDRFRARAVAQPATLLRQPITLTNDARYAVATTMVCCSLPSAQVRQLADAGNPMFAEVNALTRSTFVDLPTGHWPMWSRPRELAELIDRESRRD